MNFKKILASVAAAALAVSAMGISAFAEEADTSEWQVAVFAYSSGWGGSWTAVASENGVLTLETTVADAMEASGVASGDLGGINLQVWNVPEGQEVNYTASVGEIDIEGTGAANDEGVVSIAELATELCYGTDVIPEDAAITIAVEPVEEDNGDNAEPTDEIEYEPFETYLAVGNSADWTTAYSEKVAFNGTDTYTYSITGLSIAPDDLTVIYIKDVYAEEGGDDTYKTPVSPITVSYDSVKINGVEVTVSDDAQTAIGDSGVFDFALYNIWAESYIDQPTETITSVEITISVAAAEEDNTPVETEPEETEPEETEPEVTDPEASNTTADDGGAAAPDNSANPGTGVALAVIPAIAAAAGVIVSRKRK